MQKDRYVKGHWNKVHQEPLTNLRLSQGSWLTGQLVGQLAILTLKIIDQWDLFP